MRQNACHAKNKQESHGHEIINCEMVGMFINVLAQYWTKFYWRK